ncbi:RagB/SusD family nutrient uptake outer membrane protein [Abyssalbus ytuae]|uniref:RagB/SusD family nutrient uptake outer membrane protein n=1 Tax=Abyssalbus ytuae TaxID=2926907 RepID=A0A9E7CU70_9FLAO|nr:RagB/SusD family nutrient uptake outer membrane protein [Abyssalbus ytuae]UOB17802.1 RagB/SusD family nutrient uptake outer membrane protein [Abyssalbus ytuae]
MKFKKNNNLYYKVRVSILFFFLLLTSCHDDFLEEKPESLLSPENFPQTAQDADLVLGGISSTLTSSTFANRSLILTAELSSDETVTRYSSGDRFNIDQFIYALDNQYIEDIYSTCYTIINQSNLLLKSLPDEEWTVPYIAAAKFYRAWMYAYLVRLYGPSIIRDQPTEVVKEDEVIVRASEEEVYNFIIKDLEEAENNLPLTWTTSSHLDDGRPTRGAAKILLAKMYLSMAGWPVNDDTKWELALNKAQEVIDLGIYSLEPNFSDLFLIANKNGSEHILSIQMPETVGILSIQARPRGGAIKEVGWYLFQASPYLMEAFNDNDSRKAGTFLTELVQLPYETVPYTSFSRNSTYPHTPAINKYQDFGRDNISENASRSSLGLIIFRYAEAFLIKAEAENELNGPTDNAIAAINELRRRANTDEIESGLSKEQFRDIIRQEWSFELAYEIKRRFNLLRWGIIDDVLSADERATNGYQPFKKYFPIPQAEFDSGLDPDLQNPGY